jgi:hypothetical protein
MRIATVSILILAAGCNSSSAPSDNATTDSATNDSAVAHDSSSASDSGTHVDSSSGDSTSAIDSAIDSANDAVGTDTTSSDTGTDTGPACIPLTTGLYSLSGASGKSVLIEIDARKIAATSDGVLSPLLESGADLELTDVEVDLTGTKIFAVGAGAIHSITADATGTYSATKLGDAPGLTALANGSTHLYGAGGLTIAMITLSPFAVTTLGTLTPPAGCTKIADLYASGTALDVFLDCGASSRIKSWHWDAASSTLVDDGIYDIPAPALPAGIAGNWFTTADGKLYTWDIVTSTVTYVRDLDPCIGIPTRGMQ